jgi:hypothetical protein
MFPVQALQTFISDALQVRTPPCSPEQSLDGQNSMVSLVEAGQFACFELSVG